MLDYLVTTELDILNAGVKPTFVTARRQEVIDISLATADIVSAGESQKKNLYLIH